MRRVKVRTESPAAMRGYLWVWPLLRPRCRFRKRSAIRSVTTADSDDGGAHSTHTHHTCTKVTVSPQSCKLLIGLTFSLISVSPTTSKILEGH